MPPFSLCAHFPCFRSLNCDFLCLWLCSALCPIAACIDSQICAVGRLFWLDVDPLTQIYVCSQFLVLKPSDFLFRNQLRQVSVVTPADSTQSHALTEEKGDSSFFLTRCCELFTSFVFFVATQPFLRKATTTVNFLTCSRSNSPLLVAQRSWTQFKVCPQQNQNEQNMFNFELPNHHSRPIAQSYHCRVCSPIGLCCRLRECQPGFCFFVLPIPPASISNHLASAAPVCCVSAP